MVKGVFSKERLVHILRDFVFYPDDSKNLRRLYADIPNILLQLKC